MHLVHVTAEFEVGQTPPVVMVLDASESASGERARITAFAQELIQQLPVAAVARLYFLGNGQSYDPARFTSSAGQWFAENAPRVSLITPVYDSLASCWQQLPGVRVVVIGSGPIYDLEDWMEAPQVEATVFVSLGPSVLTARCTGTELQDPPVSDVLARLYDPVVSVEITGRGFMPYWWGNQRYHFDFQNAQVRLHTAEQSTNFALKLHGYIAEEDRPVARVTFRSGNRTTVPLRAAYPPSLPPLEECCDRHGMLDASEAEVFGQALRRAPFCCPRCGGEHAWNTLICRPRRGFSEPVYRSVPSVAGFVVFERRDDGIRYYVASQPVLPVQPDTVILRLDREAFFYRFEPDAGLWRCTGQSPEPYFPLGENRYVVVF